MGQGCCGGGVGVKIQNRCRTSQVKKNSSVRNPDALCTVGVQGGLSSFE